MINNKIKECITNNIPASFGKIGGIEASHIYNYLKTGSAHRVRGDSLAINAGIHTNNQSQLTLWCEMYMQALKNLDYVLEWTPDQGDKYIIDTMTESISLSNYKEIYSKLNKIGITEDNSILLTSENQNLKSKSKYKYKKI